MLGQIQGSLRDQARKRVCEALSDMAFARVPLGNQSLPVLSAVLADADRATKKSAIAAIGTAVFFAAMLGVILLGSAKRVMLTADGPVEILEVGSSDLGKAKVIGALSAGETVPVLGCDDLKHYIVPRVKLSGGKEGYVGRGDFHLHRESVWSSLNSPIAFGC